MRTFRELFEQPTIENASWAEKLVPKAGKVLIGGEAKTGKTFLLLNLIEMLTVGGNVWDIPEFSVPRPTRVLYVDQELGLYGLQKRLKNFYNTLGTVPRNSYFLSRVPEMELDRPGGRKMLESAIEECHAQVVVIDPISQSMWGDDSNNRDVRALFHETDILLKKYEEDGVSMVFCHHFGKPPKSYQDKLAHNPGGMYNFRGASKWVDAPDTIVTCVKSNCSLSEGKWRISLNFTFRHEEEMSGRDVYVQQGGVLHVGTPSIKAL